MESYPTEIIGEYETTQRRRKKSIRSIKQGKFRQHAFKMTSKNEGKGNKESLKKVRLINDKGEVIVEHQDRNLSKIK